jgi:hypothetical protein
LNSGLFVKNLERAPARNHPTGPVVAIPNAPPKKLLREIKERIENAIL